MTQQRTPLIIQLSATQTSAGPFDLDYRFAPQQIRSISGSCGALTSPIIILVSPVPDTGVNGKYTIKGDTSIGAHTGFFTTVSSYTGSWNDIINGPWARIKIERAAASGAATVYVLG